MKILFLTLFLKAKFNHTFVRRLLQQMNTVVFNTDAYQYLNMRSYTPHKTIPQEYTLVVPVENTLRFNSKFESGNLSKAIKMTEDSYDLYLEFDMETKGHTQ